MAKRNFSQKKKKKKAAREKQQKTYKGIPIRLTANLSAETLKDKSDEREKTTTKITLCSKDLIQLRQRNQNLYRQTKVKKSWHH